MSLLIALYGRGLFGDEVFSLNTSSNRDNCNYPFWHLQHSINRMGGEIHTSDLLSRPADISLYFNSPGYDIYTNRDYILLFETPQIHPENGYLDSFKSAKAVFTWNDDLVSQFGYEKFNFPNVLSIPEVDGWDHRDKFCSMISANKCVAISDGLDLYYERFLTLKWFEKNASNDFHLYGAGWNATYKKNTIFSKVLNKITKGLYPKINFKPFKTYNGKAPTKKEILLSSKFNICYENVKETPGYITEKIFDSFFSGCVPIYWGASNVEKYIPRECFIDRRNFSGNKELYSYMKSIKHNQYLDFQKAIRQFLLSPASSKFGHVEFSEKIVNSIFSTLKNEA